MADTATTLSMLKEEYFQLQKIVEEFDARAITIKAWSVTLSAAGLVTGIKEQSPEICLIAALSALVFWFIETLWKLHQQCYYPRISEIEDFFRKPDGALIPPLQIKSVWMKSYRRNKGEAIRVFFWPHVFMPHLVVFAAGLLLGIR